MAEELVPDFGMDASSNVPPDVPLNPSDHNRERLRFMLIGSTGYVRDMQLYLAQCRVADVGAWSRFLPAPDTSEVMSILVQYRKRS